MIDLITNQKLIWKPKSTEDDGRVFKINNLDPSDDAELLQAVSEARAALIEMVYVVTVTTMINHFVLGCFLTAYICCNSQVADLDDEFAELLLTDFSDNFNTVPSIKVSLGMVSPHDPVKHF